nr:MAG TPA: hypothetical protein [Caudoviricetes sp.]
MSELRATLRPAAGLSGAVRDTASLAGKVAMPTSVGGAGSWDELADKPFDTVGAGLKVTDRALEVDIASKVEQDNTKPISAAAVYTEVGNINALLATI